jgi:D-alanyl-D-alanine carboxypeptidase
MGCGSASGLALALIVVIGLPVAALAGRPSLTARAAVVMDGSTGQVLWERDGSRPLPPASTTKIMTAIVALESGRLEESLRVSAEAAATAPSGINLRTGQRMRLRDLLYALLLNSANDAAEVIAEGVGGSRAGFAALMNERARTLGAEAAHFENPHGLTAKGHVASARDLAVILRHGLRLPLLRDILETRTARVPIEAPRSRWVSLRSHNRLLVGHDPRVIGKTGYTRAARRCFVGAARDGDREVIVAVLGSTDLWGDTKRLIAYGLGTAPEHPPVVMAGLAPEAPSATRRVEPASSPAEGDDESLAEASVVGRGGRYSVQLGPYRDRATAAATRRRLARRGYTATLAGRTVRLGSFSSRSRAQHLAARFTKGGEQASVVALR